MSRTRYQQQQLGLVLGAMQARIDALERRAAGAEGRVCELEERLDSLSASLAKAWRELEALRPVRFAAVLPPIPPPAPRLPLERVSVAEAARRLDVDGETVRRWIESGALEGEAREIPGRRYRRWSVFRHSLDAAADAESAEITGARAG